jgi:DNA anti-recombination protein RmuC
MYGTLIKLGGILLAGVLLGWVINGWRLNASIASLKASYAEEYGRVLTEARNREKSLLEASERLRKDRDAKVKNLNSRLESVNAELQQREKRDSRESTDTAACSGATGAELSREDAEFLARFAAEADQVVENLNYCIAQYNKIRSGT